MWTFFHTVPGSGGTGRCRLFVQVKQRSSDVWRFASDAESFRLTLTGGSPRPVSCPQGYEAKYGRCLRAVRDSCNYSAATQRCQDSGAGQLAIAQSPSDLQCVWEFMKTSRVFYAWVGADDRQVAGQFRWTNGDPLPDNSPLWRHQKGEPDKWNPGGDCVRLHGAFLGLFDSPCKDAYDYVCQKL